MKSLEERRHLGNSKAAILDWQRRAFMALQHLRDARGESEQPVSLTYLSVLAFYIDHTILVVNTYASRDLLGYADHATCPDCLSVFHQTLIVAMRLIDLLLFDQLLLSISRGFHNMQLVMISHAAIEIFNIVKRGWSLNDTDQAVEKLKLISSHMERTADTLPNASYAKLYLEVFRLLSLQLDSVLTSSAGAPHEAGLDVLACDDRTMARVDASARWLAVPPDQAVSLHEQAIGCPGGLDLSLFGLGGEEFDNTTWDFGSGFIPSEFR